MTEFTTGGQRHVFKFVFEAVGAASEWMQNIREAFGEYLAGAVGSRQRKRRTASCRRTGIPDHGKSVTWRSYLLCKLELIVSQAGQ